jgi:acyl carrier protein
MAMEQSIADAGPSASLADFVCDALALVCNRDPCDISMDTPLLDLDVDSLTMVLVLAQVETAYAIEVTPDDTISVLRTVTVSDLVQQVGVLVTRTS